MITNARILVPGGLGDIYWIMTKMLTFCIREGIQGKPSIHILDDGIWASSKIRSIPFLEMIPFIKIGEPPTVKMYPANMDKKRLQKFYSSVNLGNKNAIHAGHLGYDYFLCYNGVINSGNFLEDDGLECDWYFPMVVSEEQERYGIECQKKYGKYGIFYFTFSGDFLRLNATHFNIDQMAEGINRFCGIKGITPVFIGSWWDLDWPVKGWTNWLQMLIDKVHGAVNIVGETSLAQAFGAIKGSEIVSGYHCGITNMAIAFGKKTVLLWSRERFPENTSLAVAPPDTRGTSYIRMFTENTNIDNYAGTLVDLYGK